MTQARRRKKAVNGTGSVRYDRTRSRWLASLTVGWDDAGKQRRRKKYFTTEDAAREWLAQELEFLGAQRAMGVNAARLPKTTTVGEWIAWWLEHIVPGRVSPTTEQGYHDITRLYVVPLLGKVRLSDLRPADVNAALRALAERGKSPRTQKLARSVLSTALKQAEREGLVLRNVARLADPPRVIESEGRTLTPDQAQRLLRQLESERYGAAFMIALVLGLRRGEVLALRWEDLDLERHTLSVRRSLKQIAGRWVPEETKTRRSRRTLFVPEFILPALARWRELQADECRLAGPEWSEDPAHADLMFTTAFGRPIDGSNFRRYLAQATERAELGSWTPHELRHSAASIMLAEGVPLMVVSETLGHSSVRVTADVYAHLLEPAQRSAADAMTRAFAKNDGSES